MENNSKLNFYKPLLAQVDLAEVKRYAGLRGSDFPAELLQEACTQVLLAKQLKTVWRVYDYNSEEGLVYDKALSPAGQEALYTIPGRALRKHLEGAEQVVFLAVTLGEQAEEASAANFAEGNYALGLLIDAAATTLVEQGADALGEFLKGIFAKTGWELTSRFSPGYGDWALTEQKTVWGLTGAAAIGIRLTESCMLWPRKSITAVLGLKQKKVVAEPCLAVKHACAQCSQKDCLARKTTIEA